jgi:hypothetical protein
MAIQTGREQTQNLNYSQYRRLTGPGGEKMFMHQAMYFIASN